MLPPDTCSSLLPWRVMVPLMQISGCFPYKMSKTGGPPAFSLTLFLWAVFYQMITIPSSCMVYTSIAKYHLTPEFGNTAFIYSSSFMLTIVGLLPLLLGVKSPELAATLHALSGMQGASPPPAHRWYCRPKTLAFMFLFMCSAVFMTWYVTTTWKYQEFLAVVFVLLSGVWFNLHFILPVQLCSMVFGLLARRLVVATQDTVAAVSAFLANNGSVNSEIGVRAAMLVLCDLDVVIREVEIQREKGTRCVFLVVTLYLLSGIMSAVVCPYAILTGSIMGGVTVIVMLTHSCIVFSFCHVGQAFISKGVMGIP